MTTLIRSPRHRPRPIVRAPGIWQPRRNRIDTIDKVLQFIGGTFGGTPRISLRGHGGFAKAIPENRYGDASRGGGSGSGRSCCCNVCADCKFGTVPDYFTATSSGIVMGDCSGTCYTGAPLLPNTTDTDSDPTSMNFSRGWTGTNYNKSGFTLSPGNQENDGSGGLTDPPYCNWSAILDGESIDCSNITLSDLSSSVYDNATCTFNPIFIDEDIIASIYFPSIQWILQKNTYPETWKGWLLQGVFPLCGGSSGPANPVCYNSGPGCNSAGFGMAANLDYSNYVVFPLTFFLGFIDTTSETSVDCSQTLTFDNLLTSSCAVGNYTLPDSTVLNYFACGSGGTVVVTPHIPTVP